MTEQCALWYVSHGSAGYALCDSEDVAVRIAEGMRDDGSAAPVGVQFADGRLVEVDEWSALREYRDELIRRAVAWVRTKGTVRPATRTIREPFTGRTVQVEASEPEWLGAQP